MGNSLPAGYQRYPRTG